MADENEVTLASYEAAAHRYAERTPTGPWSGLLTFLDLIAFQAPGGRVLEIGSATGRDAQLLEDRGLRVERTDGAAAFVAALRSAGHSARVLNVLTDDLGGPYDVMYASAVFLHLTPADFGGVLRKAAAAAGWLAFTVKEGDGSSWTTVKLDRPRYFMFWREAPLRALLNSASWRVESLEHVAGWPDDWLFVLARNTQIVNVGRTEPRA